MSILQGIYGIGANDTRHRSKLKKKIEVAFPDLVTAKANTPEIVLSANKVSAYTAPTNERNILTAASIIKKDILQYCSEQTKPARPPNAKQFSTSERNIPESVLNLFLTEPLKLEKHSEIVTRV